MINASEARGLSNDTSLIDSKIRSISIGIEAAAQNGRYLYETTVFGYGDMEVAKIVAHIEKHGYSYKWQDDSLTIGWIENV